jgi:hypothetical protein
MALMEQRHISMGAAHQQSAVDVCGVFSRQWQIAVKLVPQNTVAFPC